MDSLTVKEEIKALSKNPIDMLSRGLGITLARGIVYAVIHYNIYRFLKDDIFEKKLGVQSAFVPSFLAGFVAIIASQPLEVLRSIVSLKKNYGDSNRTLIKEFLTKHRSRGLFFGLLPRLLRKPLNSGISWGIMEYLSNRN